jgi:hypothetical protein
MPSHFDCYREFRNTLPGVPEELYPSAAVFCAADECDHRDCRGDPFGLVFVFTDQDFGVPDDDDRVFDIWAYVFSSETGTWGDRASRRRCREFMGFMDHSSVLVGRSLLYFMSDDLLILEYDLARHNMSVLHPPGYRRGNVGRFNIMLTEDGGLGVAEYSDPNLRLWTREASDGTGARWVLSRVINLGDSLPIAAPLYTDSGRVQLLGFAEGANLIFCNTMAGIFTVELRSEKARKVFDGKHHFCNLIPVVCFYTPARRVEHQDPLPMGPSEEAGGEEGDSVNSCFSHSLDTRLGLNSQTALLLLTVPKCAHRCLV